MNWHETHECSSQYLVCLTCKREDGSAWRPDFVNFHLEDELSIEYSCALFIILILFFLLQYFPIWQKSVVCLKKHLHTLSSSAVIVYGYALQGPNLCILCFISSGEIYAGDFIGSSSILTLHRHFLGHFQSFASPTTFWHSVKSIKGFLAAVSCRDIAT